jgi:hypothetical protein
MKKVVIGAVCAVAALATASVADARGGCGWYRHRGPYGGCRPNGGPYYHPYARRVVVARPVGVVIRTPVVGVYYRGNGYWDGHRYWGHRYAWHGGWRYR